MSGHKSILPVEILFKKCVYTLINNATKLIIKISSFKLMRSNRKLKLDEDERQFLLLVFIFTNDIFFLMFLVYFAIMTYQWYVIFFLFKIV